ncbi:hypothetical protein ABW20_dc0106013 [Dactylellina cionopaga]|nr:hypothetical protein ABW20_dc0106013 [Dactylellina cionopaga]
MIFFKANTVLSLLAAAVSAAPAADIEARNMAPSIYFGFLALHSASPIHFGSINANAGRFWIGRQTITTCPVERYRCPKGKDTSFAINKMYGMATLNTIVPGGQQLYVDPSGALSFTQPHSTYMPAGSRANGFKISGTTDGNYYLSHSMGSFLACPTGRDGGIPYQVYVNINGNVARSRKGCLEFAAAGSPVRDAVWQYN